MKQFIMKSISLHFNVVLQISKRVAPNQRESPRDAQRADKKEIAGRRRKERPLMGKKCVIFPEGGLSPYDIQPLY